MGNFTDPHTDPMPRDLAAKALKECSPSEFKVLYHIARQTLGYRKLWDRIALSQFETATALTDKTVIKALDSLYQKRWIRRRIEKAGSWYALRLNVKVAEFFRHVVWRNIEGGGNFTPLWWKDYAKKVAEIFQTQETVQKETYKETKSQSLQNFERYERGGREYAVTMQNRYGLQPEADLLEHFQKEGYDLDETSHGGGAKFLDVSDVDG